MRGGQHGYAYTRDIWGDEDPVRGGPYYKNINNRTSGFEGITSKFWDTSFSFTTLPVSLNAADGNTGCISTVERGDGPNKRIGRAFRITRVELHGSFCQLAFNSLASGPYGSTAYVAVVQDTQTNGAACLSQEIFKNILGSETGDGSATQTCLHLNLLNEPRFRILAERHIDFPPPPISWNGTNITAAGDYRVFQIDLDTNINVHCTDGSGPSIANIVDNSLHVIAFANSSIGVGLAYNCRIRFVD